MAALAKDRNTKLRGVFRTAKPKMDAVKIFKGSMVNFTVAGYAKAASNTLNEVFAGIANEAVDNSAGAAGDLEIELIRDCVFLMGPGALAQADVGNPVFVSDDNTLVNVGNVEVGTLLGFDDATGQAIVQSKDF